MTKRAENLAIRCAGGESVAAAGRAIGIGERQARRLSATPGFKERVIALRHQVINDALGKLTEATVGAVDTLRSLLSDQHPAAVRVSAARAILSHVIELQTHAEMNERITALEKRADEIPQRTS